MDGTTCNTCGIVLTAQNRKYIRNKNCNTCLESKKQKIQDLKQQKPNTQQCNKCHYFRPIPEYARDLLKTCKQCREDAKHKRKASKGEHVPKEAEDLEENVDITLEELFIFLQSKYPNVIKENLDDVIKEIIEQEQSEIESENNESEEEQQH